jgi:solute carrier family 10 (sodium/bile acid cotransporter), member 7
VVILATVLPCRGVWAQVFHGITTVSIGLLFFMHGAAVSLEAFDVPLATADPGWNDV